MRRVMGTTEYVPPDDSVEGVREALRACLGRLHGQAWGMPAGFYTSPEFLASEVEALFRMEWVCIGRVEEAAGPGDYWTVDLLGEPLLVVRAGDGRLRVFSNVCRHRGMPVASGTGNTQHLQCPYHAWTYDLRGRLVRAPLIEGRDDFDQTSCALPEVAMEVWQGFLFVNLDGQAAPLGPRLEGLVPLVRNYHMEDMVLGHCETESWETNWKCLTENFMEGYHLSTVHYETLHPVTPTRLCEHFPAGEGYLGYYSGFPADLPQRGRYHPDLTDAERGYCVMFAIMPGLVAGVAGHMATFICLQPESAGRVPGKARNRLRRHRHRRPRTRGGCGISSNARWPKTRCSWRTSSAASTRAAIGPARWGRATSKARSGTSTSTWRAGSAEGDRARSPGR